MFTLGAELIRRDDEDGLGLGVGNVDDSKIPAGSRLAQRHPRPLPARAILERTGNYIAHFVLADAVAGNVGSPE
jgi:hypothetical protein